MRKSVVLLIMMTVMGGLNMTVSGALFYEDFDALGQAAGEFGLDDASSSWWPGEDDPTLAAGVYPAACDAAAGGTNSDGCADNQTRLMDLGGGDWAFFHANWTFSAIQMSGGVVGNRGSSGILSKASYTRGNGIHCVFRAFGEPGLAPAGEYYPLAGQNFGPWMVGNTDNVSGWGTNLPAPQNNWPEKNTELGVSHWVGWKAYHEEGGGGQLDATGPMLIGDGVDGFRKAVKDSPLPAGNTLADQKANGSYWVRAELGDSTGGLQQYCIDYTEATDTCNDSGGWLPFQIFGFQTIDTRGDPVDTDGLGGTSTVGHSADVHLGFGSFKGMLVDNISVADDSSPVPVELSEWSLE